MAEKKYYMGLDIGTNSVGWAVTDENYKLKKFKSNLMWGVHLFDEAKQADERRLFRTARRRLERRKQRIAFLQEFFAAEIIKKDKLFFLRLKDSGLLPEDSEHRADNIFFDDVGYTDKDYYADYPTIHHLIYDLMNNSKPHDIRLVYLACAYLLGHRGHFLFPVSKDNIDDIKEFGPIYDEFYSALSEVCDIPAFDQDAEGMAEIIKNHNSVTAKDKELQQLLFGGKAPKPVEGDTIRYDQLTKLISGRDGVKLSDLFMKEEYKDLENNSVCVRKADFSDTLENLEGQIDEYHLALLKNVKAIYDWSLLDGILHGNTIVSKSKIEIYEKHKADLKELKYFVKKYLTKTDYDEMFREISDKLNYVSYVYNASSDDERSKYKKCTQDDFCKFSKSYLEKINPSHEDKERYDNLFAKCVSNGLCPKQVTTDNRVIPYQLYYVELKKILENASGYLPFLNKKDEYGTVAEKILSIMDFRIPYYVGPLVDSSKSENAWMKRKAEGKIYPWNFDEMVDHEESEEVFIRRMTCKCTYLAGKDVLPKHSLLYCKFNVLNEINNLTIDGKKISVQAKQTIFNELFLKKRKASVKDIKGCLVSLGEMTEGQTIGGIDTSIKSSLRSYHDFKGLISSGTLTELDVERIIERITVTTDTKRLKNWIRSEFPKLSDDKLKYISKLGYKDYGRLSRDLLEDVFELNAKTGEVMSENIITRLWETNDNLMQLLGSKYKYMESIEKLNEQFYGDPNNAKTLPERLKEMYISPAVQRSITRTVDIVKEIKGIIGKDPDKIFIEMARENDVNKKGKRTNSRREQITDILKSAKNISDKLHINELEQQLSTVDDGRLRSEKVFLYFMQLGRCMYSGRAIDFDKIGSDAYNVDHIWPQAKIKDDSLDNKVLVESKINGEKSDIYPIGADIRKKMQGFWTVLRDKDLINEKKYQRLIRSTPFSDDELAGFISRQLVETRQSTKAAAEIIKELCPNSELVYVKAGLASDMRHDLDMLKCREINDLHHAKDAYLNIVAGNVYNVKFTKDPLNFIKSGEKYQLSLFNKSSDEKAKGLLTRKVERNGEMAWDPDSSFETVRKMMSKNSIRYVRYCYKRKSGQNGGLFDQNPLRKGNGMARIKKCLPIEKYGGYDNSTISYYCIAIIEGKGAVIAAIELLVADRFEKDHDFAKQYLSYKLSTELKTDIAPEQILFPFNGRIIKINTVLELDGYRVIIVAKQNTSIKIVSLESLILDIDNVNYTKKLFGYLEKLKDNKDLVINKYSGIDKESNIRLFNILADKCQTNPFSKMYRDIGERMNGSKEQFLSYTLDEQVVVLSAMIELLKTGRKAGVDLTKVGGKKHSGVKTINSFLFKVKDYKTIRIIDQSPTGLFEKKSPNLLEL